MNTLKDKIKDLRRTEENIVTTKNNIGNELVQEYVSLQLLYEKFVKSGRLEEAEELLAYNQNKLSEVSTKNKEETSQNSWLIPNVDYGGKIENYNLSKNVLPAKNLEGHLEHRARVGEKEPGIPDMPLQYAIQKAAFNMPESEKKNEIQNFFKKSFKKYWLVSGTSVDYNPKGKDKVNHNVSGTSKEVNAVGKNELVRNSKDNEFYEAVTGEKNLKILDEVFVWSIGGSPLKCWRLNSKPKKQEKRAVGSSSLDGWSYLNTYDYLSNHYGCFGVCVAD